MNPCWFPKPSLLFPRFLSPVPPLEPHPGFLILVQWPGLVPLTRAILESAWMHRFLAALWMHCFLQVTLLPSSLVSVPVHWSVSFSRILVKVMDNNFLRTSLTASFLWLYFWFIVCLNTEFKYFPGIWRHCSLVCLLPELLGGGVRSGIYSNSWPFVQILQNHLL